MSLIENKEAGNARLHLDFHDELTLENGRLKWQAAEKAKNIPKDTERSSSCEERVLGFSADECSCKGRHRASRRSDGCHHFHTVVHAESTPPISDLWISTHL